MLALHLFLAHTVADYSFTNPMKLYGEGSSWAILKHAAWFAVVFLAFTFDTVFSSGYGITLFFGSLVLHGLIDCLRFKNKKVWWVETVSWLSFLAIGIFSSVFFTGSYITPAFAMYLVGMVSVSVIPTQIFRMIGWIPKMENESDGISERLAIFIFILALNWPLALASIGCGLSYRLIFRKMTPPLWWVSPTLGIAVSLLFRWVIYRSFSF